MKYLLGLLGLIAGIFIGRLIFPKSEEEIFTMLYWLIVGYVASIIINKK